MHKPHRHRRSLAGQLFAMQVLVVAVVVIGSTALDYFQAGRSAVEYTRHEVIGVARSVADAPSVHSALSASDPTSALQPYAEQVRKDTGADFVTIMNPQGIRYTHPDPNQIGKHFLGHTEQALAGHTFTETYTGTLGPSVRAVAPITTAQGEVIGLVSVGTTVRAINAKVQEQLLALVGIAAAALLVGGLGSYACNTRLRRHTHGMGAAELSRMYDYHQAALHAVREGLLLLDAGRRIRLCNDGGRDLLGLPDDAQGRRVDDLGLPASLTDALLAPGPRVDEVHLTAERVIVVNSSPIASGTATREGAGSVVTLRDHTALQALVGELDSERGFTEALRSQAHEAANRLHAVVSLVELGRVGEAVEFATAELELAQELTDRIVGSVAEPVLAALLLGKAAAAAERGVELSVTPDSRIDDGVIPEEIGSRDLVAIVGNLVDNAVDAAIEGTDRDAGSPRVTVTARATEGELLLQVADTGRGVHPEVIRDVFRRGWTTKVGQNGDEDGQRDERSITATTRTRGRGLGLALVEQAARRHGGTVEIGRDVGAVFTVKLPLRVAPPAAGAQLLDDGKAGDRR